MDSEYAIFCEDCGSELLSDPELLNGILCDACRDEDAAELGFLDELIDLGGQG